MHKYHGGGRNENSMSTVAECIKNGVLCLTAKDKVRLLPALNIPMDTLKKAVAVIKEAIQ